MNQVINDGMQIVISELEFKKAKNNEDEFNSFAFATHCLFSFYGFDKFITPDEYNTILSSLEKDCVVIICVIVEKYPTRAYPEVFVSKNNRLKKIRL